MNRRQLLLSLAALAASPVVPVEKPRFTMSGMGPTTITLPQHRPGYYFRVVRRTNERVTIHGPAILCRE